LNIYNTADDLGLPFHKQGFGHINLNKLAAEVISNETSYIESEGQNKSS